MAYIYCECLKIYKYTTTTLRFNSFVILVQNLRIFKYKKECGKHNPFKNLTYIKPYIEKL